MSKNEGKIKFVILSGSFPDGIFIIPTLNYQT